MHICIKQLDWVFDIYLILFFRSSLIHVCIHCRRSYLKIAWYCFKIQEIFSDQKENSEVLSTECQEQFTQAISILHLTLNKLLSGQIEIGDVLVIDTNKEAFYDLNKIICECHREDVKDKELIFQTLKLRCKEINILKDVCANMKELVLLCQHFSGKY